MDEGRHTALEARAPLGTSIEFNDVATAGGMDLSDLTGSFIPFHATETARIAARDTRPSLEALEAKQSGYVAAVRAAVRAAAGQPVAERLLLQRDADLRVRQAVGSAVLP